MKVPEDQRGAWESAYAFIHGQKNNRPKIDQKILIKNVYWLNHNKNISTLPIKILVHMMSIFLYPYLSSIFPAGISNTICHNDAILIHNPTIHKGNIFSPRLDCNA